MGRSHTCLVFWQQWANFLFVDFFEGANPPVGPGDGLTMSQETYFALCNLQRAIENATGVPEGDINLYVGPASPPVLTAEQELLFRSCVEQMIAGLTNDHFDPAGAGIQHDAPAPPGWITTGSPDLAASPILIGVQGQGVAPGTDLLGKVRGALGS